MPNIRRSSQARYGGGIESPTAGIFPARIQQIPLTEAVVQMARAGIGVALLPRWTAQPETASAVLVPLRIGHKGEFRTWYALARTHLAQEEPLQPLLRLLGESLGLGEEGEVKALLSGCAPIRRVRDDPDAF